MLANVPGRLVMLRAQAGAGTEAEAGDVVRRRHARRREGGGLMASWGFLGGH